MIYIGHPDSPSAKAHDRKQERFTFDPWRSKTNKASGGVYTLFIVTNIPFLLEYKYILTRHHPAGIPPEKLGAGKALAIQTP